MLQVHFDKLELPEQIVFSHDPLNDRIIVRILGEGQLKYVELYAMDGRLLLHEKDCGESCSITIDGNSAGIYLLRAIANNGMVKTFKFLKQ